MAYQRIFQPGPSSNRFPFHGLGQVPPALPAPAPEDVHTEHMLQAMLKRRGYTAIPNRDLREYVRGEIMTAGIGFVAGVTLGAVLGPAALTFIRRLFGR